MLTKILATTTIVFFILSIYFRFKPLKGLEEYKRELDAALHTIQLREAEIRILEGKIDTMQKALDLADKNQDRQEKEIAILQRDNKEIRSDLSSLREEFNRHKVLWEQKL